MHLLDLQQLDRWLNGCMSNHWNSKLNPYKVYKFRDVSTVLCQPGHSQDMGPNSGTVRATLGHLANNKQLWPLSVSGVPRSGVVLLELQGWMKPIK